jgi:hypothetical protein
MDTRSRVKENPKPQPGDRVKLIGTHKYAGWTGIYLYDAGEKGKMLPKVKLWKIGTVTSVPDPENQMRKLDGGGK